MDHGALCGVVRFTMEQGRTVGDYPGDACNQLDEHWKIAVRSQQIQREMAHYAQVEKLPHIQCSLDKMVIGRSERVLINLRPSREHARGCPCANPRGV